MNHETRNFFSILLFLLLLSQTALSQETPNQLGSREWTSLDGKTLHGSLRELIGESVTINSNGRNLKIPITRLSEADQSYLAEWQQMIKLAEEPERQWTSSQGKRIKATLVSVKGNTVSLRIGSLFFHYKRNQFSQPDQGHFDRWLEQWKLIGEFRPDKTSFLTVIGGKGTYNVRSGGPRNRGDIFKQTEDYDKHDPFMTVVRPHNLLYTIEDAKLEAVTSSNTRITIGPLSEIRVPPIFGDMNQDHSLELLSGDVYVLLDGDFIYNRRCQFTVKCGEKFVTFRRGAHFISYREGNLDVSTLEGSSFVTNRESLPGIDDNAVTIHSGSVSKLVNGEQTAKKLSADEKENLARWQPKRKTKRVPFTEKNFESTDDWELLLKSWNLDKDKKGIDVKGFEVEETMAMIPLRKIENGIRADFGIDELEQQFGTLSFHNHFGPPSPKTVGIIFDIKHSGHFKAAKFYDFSFKENDPTSGTRFSEGGFGFSGYGDPASQRLKLYTDQHLSTPFGWGRTNAKIPVAGLKEKNEINSIYVYFGIYFDRGSPLKDVWIELNNIQLILAE